MQLPVPDPEPLSPFPFLTCVHRREEKLAEATVEMEGRTVTAPAYAQGALSSVP